MSTGARPPADDGYERLFEASEKIHPREVSGAFARLRVAAVWVLLGVFYGLPWLRWDDRQAVLFDLPARQFHVFGLTFWPQDFLFLAWLLILCALGLFFVTAVAGRVWCGYACPQTVWTQLFVWLERLAEGPRHKRIRLDRSPWNREKIARRSLKHVLWVVLALFTGFTFVGYFTPVTELAAKLATFTAGPWETFWVLFYGFATWGNAGFLREQVCIYMCPYARFQSAMFDRDTLIISYDEARGEPRGKRARDLDHRAAGLGDCIDCTLCVQACPTGIDIRKGLQYECIACAACIDACDTVMDKMNYPRGLIRYSTQNAMEGTPARVLRPRTIVYATLLTILAGLFVWSIATRPVVSVDVIRDRNALYRITTDNRIENVYTLRVLNKQAEPRTYAVEAHGLPEVGVAIDMPAIILGAGELRSVPARISVPDGVLDSGGHDVRIRIVDTADADIAVEGTARFMVP